ncbi:MAG: hypothetical protein FWG14_11495 [Peptococcaceae bacterium]|nr:hypothetical protein [Peptococcaceae bacterium]
MSKNAQSSQGPSLSSLWIIILIGLVLLISGVGILTIQNAQRHVEEINEYDPAYVPGRVVDHRDVVLIEEYLKNNPEAVQAVAQTNYFFAHGSLGGNIVEGLSELHTDNAALYSLTIETLRSSTPDPPPEVQPGTVYAVNRGNQSTDNKRSWFDSYMDKGWGRKVTAVLNKYSYRDSDTFNSKSDKIDMILTFDDNLKRARAEAESYTYSMGTIQLENPDLKVVFTTMPLVPRDDRANMMRYAFNQWIRDYCQTNGYFLLDIADIESHYPDGTPNTGFFAPADSSFEQMVSLYTSDGGHLNVDGKRLVAKAWYAMAVAVTVK